MKAEVETQVISRSPDVMSGVPARAEEYAYSVAWLPEDATFVARVAEFASLAAHAATPRAALDEIIGVVGAVLQDLRGAGEDVPAPYSRRAFSGETNLRMPREVHRRLATEAAREGVSLNQLIVARLGG